MFTALCQGASISPFSFHYIMRTLLKFLQKCSVQIFCYVDDLLILGRSIVDFKTNINLTIDIFKCAGFLLNFEKSQLEPTQKIEFLGFDIDSTEFTVSLTQSKRQSILRLVSTILDNPSTKIKIRHLAVIIGKIVSTFPSSDEAQLHYRVLDRFKVKCLRAHNNKWDSKVSLSTQCLQELQWWKDNILTDTMKKSLHIPQITAHVYSDSSGHSFGGFYKHHTISSRFSERQQKLSIKLLAMYYTLSAFAKIPSQFKCAPLL